jgi:very-short-patch-repair endonuclease
MNESTEITVNYYKKYSDKLISYIHNNIELFDMYHILFFLKSKKSCAYDMINSIKFKYFSFRKNIYNGYILTYLIDLDEIKKILSTCRSIKKQELCKLLNIPIHNIALVKEEKYNGIIHKVFKNESMVDQYKCGKYKIDLYFTHYKIAIECDEFNHKDRDPEYEKIREDFIKKNLDCTFIRYNPDEPNFDIYGVLNKIHDTIVSKINNKL